MNLPLNEFEELIDEKILNRGYTYFYDDAVVDCKEISTGVYKAIVHGSEAYTVSFRLEDDIVSDYSCDCPYDKGPVCKHVAAVIFYLEDEELWGKQKKTKKSKKKKSKSKDGQVKELLREVSHKDLVKFVQENCKRDTVLRSNFLSSFGHLNQNNSKEFYQNQIKAILDSVGGKGGWIGWSEMKFLINAVTPIINNIEQYLQNKNYEDVFFASTAMLEEMTNALDYADDSDIGYFISSAYQLLSELVEKDLPDNLRRKIIDYCISTFKQKLFDGWDWHFGIIEIACQLITTAQDADIVIDCLNNMRDGYQTEYAQFIKLDLLRRFKSKEETEIFINKNISNSSIRSKEIEIAFEAKNFERVVSLSKDGIEYDKDDKPGLVKDWYNWLLKVAQAQSDRDKIIEYARFLFIDNFYPEQDYYQILKNTIPDNNWHPFLERIIEEITPKGNWTYSELIRSIYINEEWWDRLLFMLRDNASLDNIEKNEKYLSKDYTPELLEMYSERITTYVEKHKGRSNYQRACSYLRRMKKLGGHNTVREIIVILRKKYPRRPALLDELSNV